MKDPEMGEVLRNLRLRQAPRREVYFTFKKMLALAACASAFVSVMFGVGLIASHCERYLNGEREVIFVDKSSYAMKQHLERRGVDCNETETASIASAASSATHFLSDGSIAIVTKAVGEPDGETVVDPDPDPDPDPDNLQRQYPPERTVVTKTTTKTTSVFAAASESPVCPVANATVTVTYTVVPTASPASQYSSSPWMSSSVLGDITVTGGASTVTNVNTDLSYTSDLPDVTVTGNPSTLTNVNTDVSLTTDLPDVTVSGNPGTVTNVQTDVSMTSGLPDATVSGGPSTITNVHTSTSLTSNPTSSVLTVVITDLWSSPVPSLVTVTATSTVKTTVTTVHPSPVIVTVTTSYLETSTSSYTETTVTEFLTTTNGEPQTLTTTVWSPSVSYSAGNTTIIVGPSGTASNIGVPTTPVVVISGGTKKPEPIPRSGHLGCVIMFVAAIMFML
ncbi:hypothetical protein PT974_08503 [Cladobotryum mycophilum]|uniref:Uncharacterized protein n=1 Tax=Cladobotryum mycophilum TaxID=491253 RepID=A0ABR0SDI6_9HYPO